MNGLFLAADEVQRYCQERGWSFCFIGGLATLRWGDPRTTRDVDLTILAGFGKEGPIIDGLLGRFTPRLQNARQFAFESRVVLVTAGHTVPVDVALGALDFEERAVHRASQWETGEVSLLTASAEDLMVHKVFAGRERDWADVAGIINRQGAALKRDIVVAELAPLLEAKGAIDDLIRLEGMLGNTGVS